MRRVVCTIVPMALLDADLSCVDCLLNIVNYAVGSYFDDYYKNMRREDASNAVRYCCSGC